jgi:mannose/fructose-specific phosphotransferase system component IIA
MIGIVLVTHGRLGSEFRATLEHVVGPQKQIESIAIGPDDNIEQRRQDIVSAVTKVDKSIVAWAWSCSQICSAARPPISQFRL